MARRFAIIGRKASASDEFILDDLPGTSGRLDILARCLRAALLSSHGVRTDVVVYLVLQGGPLAPRVVRVAGSRTRFLRPDERSLAVLLKKVLSSREDHLPRRFVEVRRGIALARGDLDLVLADAGGAARFVLEEDAPDLRLEPGLEAPDVLFVLGDHMGLAPAATEALAREGARPISIGPVTVHADDAVAVVTNELDRRASRRFFEGGDRRR